jgi:heterodisulfide reductase subunit A
MTDEVPAALVIGGGIAGIRASLDIAEAGYMVHLVEREASIGGRMAQLDKTFPTLDCSSCILTPLMVDVGRHPNIVLHTLSEVREVDPVPGDGGSDGASPPAEPRYRVEVVHKPRYVNLDACTGCGSCARACRLRGRVIDAFNEGLGKRAAAYVPFPQAVPLKYAIDPDSCLYLTRGTCGRTFLCKEACSAGAIELDQVETSEVLYVHAIVLATGFDLLGPATKPEFGYGRYPEVLTGIEFERLAAASGPTAGEIVVNGRQPRDVVFIKCVGSRDPHAGVPYCSRVCCMYTAKQAHLVRERLPDARITIFYIDVRAFGKGCEEFYDRVRREGAVYRRGEPGEVWRKGDRLVVSAEDTLLGQPVQVEADLVVLANAILPRRDAAAVAQTTGVRWSSDGFFRELDPVFAPVATESPNIFVAGCCAGPKDIPDTIAEAKAAAASALVALSYADRASARATVVEAACQEAAG